MSADHTIGLNDKRWNQQRSTYEEQTLVPVRKCNVGPWLSLGIINEKKTSQCYRWLGNYVGKSDKISIFLSDSSYFDLKVSSDFLILGFFTLVLHPTTKLIKSHLEDVSDFYVEWTFYVEFFERIDPLKLSIEMIDLITNYANFAFRRKSPIPFSA